MEAKACRIAASRAPHPAPPALSRSRHVPVPVRAYVSNELHPSCTTVELQALDRIGLLHDLFHTINLYGLNTAHARICTEKGVAMDTLYITTPEGGKVLDPAVLQQLEDRFTALVARPEATVSRDFADLRRDLAAALASVHQGRAK